MTVSNVHVLPSMSDEEKRAAARRDLAADPNLTGAAVARRYGMSDGWGRKVARAERDSTPAAQPVAVQHGAVTPSVPVPVTRDGRGWVHTVTVLAVLTVAGVAAVLSYAHMRHLGIQAGEGWRADLLPLSVDGMMVAASMTALAKRRQGKPALVAWLGLALGVAASLAANIAAAEPTLTGRLLAGWPPLALVLAFELLLEQGRDE